MPCWRKDQYSLFAFFYSIVEGVPNDHACAASHRKEGMQLTGVRTTMSQWLKVRLQLPVCGCKMLAPAAEFEYFLILSRSQEAPGTAQATTASHSTRYVTLRLAGLS